MWKNKKLAIDLYISSHDTFEIVGAIHELPLGCAAEQQ